MAEPKSPRGKEGVLTRTKSAVMRRASIVHDSVGNFGVLNPKDKQEKDIVGKLILKTIYKNKPIAELIQSNKAACSNYTKDVTPLYAACAWGRMERVKELVNQAEVDINKGKGHSPLYAVMFNNQSLAIAEFLIDKGCDLATKDVERWIKKHPRIKQKAEIRRRREAESVAHEKERAEWNRRFAELERRVQQLEAIFASSYHWITLLHTSYSQTPRPPSFLPAKLSTIFINFVKM